MRSIHNTVVFLLWLFLLLFYITIVFLTAVLTEVFLLQHNQSNNNAELLLRCKERQKDVVL